MLDEKLEKTSKTTLEDISSGISVETSAVSSRKKIVPEYKFHFVSYTVGESVEYKVELLEIFKVYNR